LKSRSCDLVSYGKIGLQAERSNTKRRSETVNLAGSFRPGHQQLCREPWDKRPEQWNLAETYQILSDSPWSPAKTAVELTFEKRYVDPLTNRRVELPNANRATAVERAQFGRQPKIRGARSVVVGEDGAPGAAAFAPVARPRSAAGASASG